jgi:signal transduction histidine kinase
MADPIQLRPKSDLQSDREALEHIARAVQGRVLRGPSLSPAGALGLDTLSLGRASIEALLEAMPAAIGILAHGELVHANAAFAYAFGYRSFDELAIGGGLEAIVPGGISLLNAGAPTSRERTIALDALTRGRRRLKISLEVKSLAGEFDLLRLVDGATPEPDTPALIEAVPSDDTAVKEAEEDLGAASVMRRLDFLAKVSHEVRTPLNSILGFTELMLEERLGPIGNARYKSYVEDIHQSGLYALSLLNDLLDISKIDAGKFDLDFTAVDVPEFVEACVNSLQPLAKRERILLRTSLSPNLPAVIADRRRLKQILLNLLSNAIKFTNAGGQVIVSARLIDGGDLRLRVHDTGVGMTKDEVAAAMQPFHQLGTAPRRQTGTGLGLPVTKALAGVNRARLLIASERGAGTSADVIFSKDRLAAL